MKKKLDINTQVVQSGIGTAPAQRAIIPPLYLTSTYEIPSVGQKATYEYSRTRNPTRDELAAALTILEGGYKTHITSSGMAALTLILHVLNPEDLLLAPYDCYGRSHRLLSALAEKKHFRLKFVDPYTQAGYTEMALEKARMILLETPSNPLMRVCDIQAICARANDALVVVDNTFLSPVLQRPLELGADIVYHSTTKFLNGHSDVVGGCVVVKSPELAEQIDFWSTLGVVGAPFDSYMTLRGLRTLELRVLKAQENAQFIAPKLRMHPAISKVYYPETGSMLSLEISGDFNRVKTFVSHLKLFHLAQSLGGTESLINHPSTMTHVSMGTEARANAGITDQLLRLSFGIENPEELWVDLENALNKTFK